MEPKPFDTPGIARSGVVSCVHSRATLHTPFQNRLIGGQKTTCFVDYPMGRGQPEAERFPPALVLCSGDLRWLLHGEKANQAIHPTENVGFHSLAAVVCANCSLYHESLEKIHTSFGTTHATIFSSVLSGLSSIEPCKVLGKSTSLVSVYFPSVSSIVFVSRIKIGISCNKSALTLTMSSFERHEIQNSIPCVNKVK